MPPEHTNGTYTLMTSTLSDNSGLVVDPDDREKAQQDLTAFKEYISSLKFAYLESDMKLRFVSHVLDKDGCKPVSQTDTNQSDEQRASTKAALRERKARAQELERLIRQQAVALDGKVQKVNADAAEAAQLLRECDEMDNEITLLKSKRPHPVERTTIEEARALCDEQLNKMSQCGPALVKAEANVKETKARLRSLKHDVEKMTREVRELQREDDDRRAKGFRDERAEADCQWIAIANDVYNAAIGIKSVSIRSANGSLVSSAASQQGSEIVVDYLHDDESTDVRTLSISIDPTSNTFTGAKLVNSSIDISDIVDECLPRQAIRTLVQEVRSRISR